MHARLGEPLHATCDHAHDPPRLMPIDLHPKKTVQPLSQFLSVCLGDAVPLDCGPASLDFIGKRLELARNVLPHGN